MILVEHSEPTQHGSEGEVLGQLVKLIEALAPASEAPDAIGVSVAAAPDPASGRLRSISNIHGLLDVPLGAALHRRLAAKGWILPIVVGNDAELAALAEGRIGAAVGLRDFVSITIGTGIGMGVVLDGETRRGWRGMAGEIAFLPVPTSEAPHVDNAGAFEALVGGRTLAARCIAEIERAERDGEHTNLDRDTTVATALDLTGSGDQAAIRLIQNECADLAVGIAAVCAVIDPQLVVLSGGIGSLPGLVAPVREAVSAVMANPPRIETSALGERAPLLGALERARDAANAPGPGSTEES